MTTPLDSFETRLLAELRAVVAAREPDVEPAPRRRAWLMAPAGAVAAATAAAVLVPVVGPDPAYAVTAGGSGEVHVRVERLEDAAGLERALEQEGIAADVVYLPDDTVCAPGRYEEAPARSGDFGFTTGAGHGYTVDLGAGLVQEGETLVISAARLSPTGDPDGDGVSDEGGAAVSIGIATGPVGPCVPRPA